MLDPEIIARTENPLENAGAGQAKKPPPPPKEAALKGKGAAGAATQGFVPPPPPNGETIKAPVGMPNVKTYPVSTHAPPSTMNFPGVDSAAKGDPAGGEDAPIDNGPAADGGEPAEEDDGFTPEQREKMRLEDDPDFATFLKMKRMRIPLHNIRAKMRAGGKFDPLLMDLFSDAKEIEDANFMLI